MTVSRVMFKNGAPDEEMFKLLFGEGYQDDLEINFDAVEDGEPYALDLAAAESGSWNGSASRFTDEQYKRACLVDTGQGEGKSRYKLPVREPSGKINLSALKSAYQSLAGARGGVQLSQEKRKSALRKLRGLYRRVGQDVPEGLQKLADLGTDMDLDEAIYDFAVDNMAKSKGNYTDEQWRRACVLQNGPSDDYDGINSEWELPIRSPDGTLDERAMRGAVKKLVNSKHPQEIVRRAAKQLVRHFNSIDENAPDSLLGLAGQTQKRDYYYSDTPTGDDDAFLLTPLLEEDPADLVFAEEDADGKVRFWKQLLPYRKFTYSKGKVRHTVNITKKFAEKVVANFGKAPEMCTLLMTKGNEHHEDGPANTAGEIEKIEARKDGVYGLCAVLEDSAKILKAFPKMGISVGLNTNYVRRSDGKKFGPIIFHGAVTSRPYLHGMKPWELVMSDAVDLAEVVNLSEGEYEVVEASEEGDQSPSEGGKVKVTVVDGRVVVLDDDGNEVQDAEVAQEVTAAAAGGATGTPDTQLSERLTLTEQNLAQERRERREERNSYRMDTQYRRVPPAFKKVVLPLINLADAQDGQEITLTEGEGDQATERKLTSSKALWELADYMAANHAIELGERGNQEEEQEKAEDVQIADLADAYAKEHELTYAEALVEVQNGERPSQQPAA